MTEPNNLSKTFFRAGVSVSFLLKRPSPVSSLTASISSFIFRIILVSLLFTVPC